MNFYHITLMVTVEQEDAIMELYRERRWIYWKTGHGEKHTSFQLLNDQYSTSHPAHPVYDTFQTPMPDIQNRSFTEQLFGDRNLNVDNSCCRSSNVENSRAMNIDNTRALNSENSRSLNGETIRPLHMDNNTRPLNLETSRSLDVENTRALNMENTRSLDVQNSRPLKIVNSRPLNTENSRALNVENYRNPSTDYSCRQGKAIQDSLLSSEFSQAAVSKEPKNDKINYNRQFDPISDDSGPLFESTETEIELNKLNDSLNTDSNLFAIDFLTARRRNRNPPKKPENKMVNIYCAECEHTFRYKESYEKHFKEDRCKHICEFCGKVFLYSRTKDYKIHLKYHTNQKDHECDVCGRQFVERGSLLKHYLKHTNPKPKKERKNKRKYQKRLRKKIFVVARGYRTRNKAKLQASHADSSEMVSQNEADNEVSMILDGDNKPENEMEGSDMKAENEMEASDITTENEVKSSASPSVLLCEFENEKEVKEAAEAAATEANESEIAEETEVEENNTGGKKQRRSYRSREEKYLGTYCKDCDHTFRKKGSYERHLREDRCRHECEICGKVFLYSKTNIYKIHMKYHRNEKDHQCKICGKLFVEKGTMQKHIVRHNAGPRPYICDQCGFGFESQLALNVHQNKMHNANINSFPCPACPKVFNSKAGVLYHFRHNHDTSNRETFPCSVCGKHFKARKFLKVHEASHKETKEFKCDQCNAAFKLLSALKQHQKRHDKAFNYFCKICNKGFFESAQVQAHEWAHTGKETLALFCV